MKSYKKIQAFLLVLIGIFIGCSNSTEPEEPYITEPQVMDLSERLPEALLQTEAAGAYGVLLQVNVGATFYDLIYSSVNEGNNWNYTYTYDGLTVRYTAEPETRNGMEGTTWKWIYDGTITSGEETINFDDTVIWNGWTANSGTLGSYTWDYSKYTNVEGSGSTDGVSTYEVDWSVSDDNTLTATIEVTDSGETYTSTVTVAEDGSGTLEQDYPGTESDQNYAWDAQGNLI